MKSKYIFLLMLPLLAAMTFLPNGSEKCQFDLDDQTVEVKPGLWMGKCEVSNKLYKEFLMGLIVNGRAADVPEFAPELKVWEEDMNFNDPYTQYYFKHPAFDNYPVVGVSHAAAMAFCDWLTAESGSFVCAKATGKSPTVHYRFRLPTKAEWELAASPDDSKSYSGFFAGGHVYPRDGKGNFLFNHKLGSGNYAGVVGTDNPRDYEGYMITGPVRSFKPDRRGLYNMSGNVAEMVLEDGVSKGGSWADESPACRIEAIAPYDGPNAKTGFRFVMEALNGPDSASVQ